MDDKCVESGCLFRDSREPVTCDILRKNSSPLRATPQKYHFNIPVMPQLGGITVEGSTTPHHFNSVVFFKKAPICVSAVDNAGELMILWRLI